MNAKMRKMAGVGLTAMCLAGVIGCSTGSRLTEPARELGKNTPATGAATAKDAASIEGYWVGVCQEDGTAKKENWIFLMALLPDGKGAFGFISPDGQDYPFCGLWAKDAKGVVFRSAPANNAGKDSSKQEDQKSFSIPVQVSGKDTLKLSFPTTNGKEKIIDVHRATEAEMNRYYHGSAKQP